MGTGSIWENSALSAQFCCEHKAALKNSLLIFFNLKEKDDLEKIFKAKNIQNM